MGINSRKEIRDNVLSTTRQDNTQIGTLVNDFINLTLNEINDTGWAFTRNNYNHLWTWLRRKTTFVTASGTEDYVMAREVDRIAIMRQTSSPVKLRQIPDDKFFELVPYPTASGNPSWYRIWETEGLSTRISTAEKINVSSSSSSDAGSAELKVTVVGFVSGILTSETYQLNGTATVSGTNTFQAREVFVSKQKTTTGTISVVGNTSATTLLTLGAEDRAPRFKVVTLYPKPNSALTIYLEYYTRIRDLANDSDVPEFDKKWHYVVRLGTLAKVYQYLNKETDFIATQALYTSAVKSMVSSDLSNPDLITQLSRRIPQALGIHNRRSEDAIA